MTPRQITVSALVALIIAPFAVAKGRCQVSEELSYIEPAIRSLAVPVDDIDPDPANARTHNDRNIHLVRSSLAGFRQQTPIVIDGDRICRKGNATLAAARLLGWTHIAAVQTTLKGSQAIAYAIADNRSGDTAVGSQWDEPALVEFLKVLPHELPEPVDLGFSSDEIAGIEADLHVPEFAPVPIDQQPRLDQKAPVTCPHCGQSFSPDP